MRNMKADAVDGLDQAFRKIEMHTQVPDVENTAAHSRSSGGKACMPICAALARVTALVATPLRSAAARARCTRDGKPRSEEHTSELQSLMRISYAVFCLKKKNNTKIQIQHPTDSKQLKVNRKRKNQYEN